MQIFLCSLKKPRSQNPRNGKPRKPRDDCILVIGRGHLQIDVSIFSQKSNAITNDFNFLVYFNFSIFRILGRRHEMSGT